MRPRERARFVSRFDRGDAQDPVTSLTNLVDVMLVVACGLAAALVAAQERETSGEARATRGEEVREVVRGREIPSPPSASGRGGQGYVPVGRVFRDPRTGSLVLVDEGNGSTVAPTR